MIPQSLFKPLSFNTRKSVKLAMIEAKQKSDLSCDQIVDRMNDLAEQYGVALQKRGGKMSLDTFETLLNPNKLNRNPTPDCLLIFCASTDSIGPMQALAEPLGAKVIDSKDAKLLAWAQKFQAAKKLRQDMKKIEAEL